MRRKLVADPERTPSASSSGRTLVRNGLPDAEREAVRLGDALEDPRRAEPAVLVVDGDDAPARRDAQALARRIDELVLARHREARAEPPRGLLAQDSRRRAGLVALDDAALDCEVAARPRKRRRVEPGRVVVPREEQRRTSPVTVVECYCGRLLVPLRRAPAGPTDPRSVTRVNSYAFECLGEPGTSSSLTSRCDSDHVGK